MGVSLPLAKTVFLPKGQPKVETVEQVNIVPEITSMSMEDNNWFLRGSLQIMVDYISSECADADWENALKFLNTQRAEDTSDPQDSIWQSFIEIPFSVSLEEEWRGDLEALNATITDVQFSMPEDDVLELNCRLILSETEDAVQSEVRKEDALPQQQSFPIPQAMSTQQFNEDSEEDNDEPISENSEDEEDEEVSEDDEDIVLKELSTEHSEPLGVSEQVDVCEVPEPDSVANVTPPLAYLKKAKEDLKSSSLELVKNIFPKKAEKAEKQASGQLNTKPQNSFAQALNEIGQKNPKRSSGYKLKFYRVQEGEDIIAIAEKMQVSSDDILALNHLNEEDICVGTLLTIPK